MNADVAKKRVVVVRHGVTKYLLGNSFQTSLAVEDLTDDGVSGVKQSAREISSLIRQGSLQPPTRVFSSPTGRCIHTSRLLLEEMGRPASEIELTHELREIDGYERRGFMRAMREAFGGNEPFDDDQIAHVFVYDKLFDAEIFARLSPESQAYIRQQETSEAAKNRAFRVMEGLTGGEMLVTHDGIACQLVRSATNSIGLTRGKFVVFVQEPDGKWVVERTNDEKIVLK